MSDPPLDKTAYSDAHGGLRVPPKQGRYVDDPLDDEDLARLVVRATPFPGIMLAAGVLWLLAGAAYIGLFVLMRLLEIPLERTAIWLVLGAFFYIKDGVQLLRGKFRDPQADGIISVLLGLFFLGQGLYQFAGEVDIVGLMVAGFFGVFFLIPGILVLLGRKQYLAWKAEQ